MKSQKIFLRRKGPIPEAEIHLPASKSINNRALIIKALSGQNTRLLNPSNARDSELMRNLIGSKDAVIDARDAGTTFRFLTAYYSISSEEKILTGTERMKKRPIGTLVDALLELGANISYMEEEGYPPLKLSPFKRSSVTKLNIRGDISSQYISAIMMIVPAIGGALEIELTGSVGSRPYIEMTGAIMKSFGAKVLFNDKKITIGNNAYRAPEEFGIEPDWSAASYWYSLICISGKGSISLKDLKDQSLQGDRVIADIMYQLGTKTTFNEHGALLEPCPHVDHFIYDFTNCPDLAQTVAVVCAAKGIPCTMTGLESLRIKETDRIQALKTELSKFDVTFSEEENTWKIRGKAKANDTIDINTYEDHRMAMAFAPLSIKFPLSIDNPEVVNKSYPHFWDDFERITTS